MLPSSKHFQITLQISLKFISLPAWLKHTQKEEEKREKKQEQIRKFPKKSLFQGTLPA